MAQNPLAYLVQFLRRPPNVDGEPLADAELLRRYISSQDAAAFELLVWRHGPMVLSTCRRITRNDTDAEDAFQATFLILARKAHSVRTSTSLASWLHRTAHRVAVRCLNRHPHEALPHDMAAKPTVHIEADELTRLDAEINALGERHRRVIVLCYLQGHTTEDAAKLLGIPRGTVLSRLATARTQLAARLTLPAVLGGSVLSLEQVRAALQPTHPTVFLLANGVLQMMIRKQILVAFGVLSLIGVTSSGIAIIAQNGGPGATPSPVVKAAEVAKPPAEEAKRNAVEEREKRLTVLQNELSLIDLKILSLQKLIADLQKPQKTLTEAEIKIRTEIISKLAQKIFDSEVLLKKNKAKIANGWKEEQLRSEILDEEIVLKINLEKRDEILRELKSNHQAELNSPIRECQDQIRRLQIERQFIESAFFKLRFPEANITAPDKLDQVLAELAELRREVRELKERK